MLFKFFKGSELFIDSRKEITLKKICNIMDISIPKKFKAFANEVNNHLTLYSKKITPGTFYFMPYGDSNMKSHLDDAIEKGAKVIFVNRKEFDQSNLSIEDYPCILLDDHLNQVGELFLRIKSHYNPITIAITGTVGKTTTNKLLTSLVKPSFRTLAAKGNLNSYMATANHIANEVDDETQLFLQEVGAAELGSIRKSARMLNPNGFILLNVKNHHMNTYKTYDKLFEDKSSFDDYLKPDGVVVANFDDEGIASHQFKHRVISFGIETSLPVDYRAINIEQNNEFLEFDVLYEDQSKHIVIELLGKHNVYNALAAFAMARHLMIPDDKLVKRFRNYRSAGIRQNFSNVGGRYLYVDCYNVCEASILATFDAMNEITVSSHNRKIAIIGGENKLGSLAAEVNYRIGTELKNANVSEIVLFGTDKTDHNSIDRFGDAYSVYQGLQDSGYSGSLRIITDLNQLAEYLKANNSSGDLIFFKGIIYLDMAIAIDKAFGTSYSYGYRYYFSEAIDLFDSGFSARVIKKLGECEILGFDNSQEILNIPNQISNYPVSRIKAQAFKEHNEITQINFGDSIQNIGRSAFAKCTSLKSLTIPSNVKVLEASCFRGCNKLETVLLENGVRHIGKNAFSDNPILKAVHIPPSVGNIENDAFITCEGLTIYCESCSFAEKYAKENHINYLIKD